MGYLVTNFVQSTVTVPLGGTFSPGTLNRGPLVAVHPIGAAAPLNYAVQVSHNGGATFLPLADELGAPDVLVGVMTALNPFGKATTIDGKWVPCTHVRIATVLAVPVDTDFTFIFWTP
jgi:hypothetical protein